MSLNSDSTSSILSCLPPELDYNDSQACDDFMIVASDEQKIALMNLMLIETINNYKEAREICKQTADAIYSVRRDMIYSTVVSEGGPLPPPVEINGRLYPDDMPKEYTKFSFFEDIISLPPQYLNKWLILHGERPEIFKSMDHLDRSKLLFVLKGGTMNDSVRKYEKERNEKRTLETIDLTGEDGKPKRPRRSCTKK